MRKLIGITGFARSGKDTFFKRCEHYLSQEGKVAKRFAFADALKLEVDSLLSEHTGISAFTEKDSEKEMIRPLLVTYGTDIRRALNPNCWIEKIQPNVIKALSNNEYVFITDVRYANEAQWIQMNNGLVINIRRHEVGPANHEEHRQSVRMKKHIAFNLDWPTFGENDLHLCDEYVVPALKAFLNNMVDTKPSFEEVA